MRGGVAPSFWWRKLPGWEASLLSPAALAYGAVSGHRLDHGRREAVAAPVICVGNFTVGGGGKTPACLALAKAAKDMGRRPGFLSRGHGGSARRPLLVDLAQHDAALVGDEPLLLASGAPTAVGSDRAAGAQRLIEAGCDLLIMDDGFQSARLRTDFALLVADARRGLGNGHVLPAGPLRAPLATQLRYLDGLLVVGDGNGAAELAKHVENAGKPVFRAEVAATDAAGWSGRRVLAFAGIADPGKLYRSLEGVGTEIAATRDFPDHHPFRPGEIESLLAKADQLGAELATTRKDAVRLAALPGWARISGRLLVLDVELRFAGEAASQIVTAALAAFARRQTLTGAAGRD